MESPSILKISNQGIALQLIKAARIATISVEELEKDPMILIHGLPDEPLSELSEIATSQYLIEKCRTLFTNYPTSPEEDLELLNDPNLSYNQRMAIQMRYGEKRIIEKIGSHYYNRLKKQIEDFEKTHKFENKDENKDEL